MKVPTLHARGNPPYVCNIGKSDLDYLELAGGVANLRVKMVSLLNIAAVDDLLLLIQEFVPISSLLISSKSLALLKWRYFRWNLTKAASQRFNQSEPYRDLLLSRMVYPNKQLK